MPDLPIYIADTHGLIWYFYASPKLGPNALAAYQAVGRGEARLIVPAIVIAEMVYDRGKGKGGGRYRRGDREIVGESRRRDRPRHR